MGRLASLVDNPIVVRYARSQLRPSKVWSWSGTLVLLCSAILVGCMNYATPGRGGQYALAAMLGFQAILLAILGSQQIASAVGGARGSGMLEYHRLTPMTPAQLAAGFLLGPPVREYLLYLLAMPFAVAASVAEGSGPVALLVLEIPLVLLSWVLHAVTLLSALAMKRPATSLQGSQAGIAGAILFLIFLGGPISGGLWYVVSIAGGPMPTLAFFRWPLPWLAFVVFYELAALAFFVAAAARRMRSERAHALSKGMAVGGMAGFTILTLGAFWEQGRINFLAIGILYALTIAALVLIVPITPGLDEYERGVRRALRRGRRRPSPWSDTGANRLAVAILAAIVLAGSTLAWEVIEGRRSGGSPESLTFAIGVFVVVGFGLGGQFCLLRFRRSGTVVWQLVLFATWVLPMVVGGAIAFGRSFQQLDAARLVAALSPITGIGILAAVRPGESADAVRLAALLPTITMACLAHYLLIVVLRRIDRAQRQVVATARDAVPATANGAVEIHPVAH